MFDNFIGRLSKGDGSSVHVQNNLFDHGVRFQTDDIVLYSFSVK